MKKITRRQVLAGSGVAVAGAALVGRQALSQASPHQGHGAPAQMDHSQHGGHQGHAMPASKKPAVAESDAVYRTPKGNPWYARTVDPDEAFPPGEPGRDYTPVLVPNGATLPFQVVGDTKVFHLVAEEVTNEFAPGFKAFCWGYNGQMPGPVIEAVEGDQIRIYVTSKLKVPTTRRATHRGAVSRILVSAVRLCSKETKARLPITGQLAVKLGPAKAWAAESATATEPPWMRIPFHTYSATMHPTKGTTCLVSCFPKISRNQH